LSPAAPRRRRRTTQPALHVQQRCEAALSFPALTLLQSDCQRTERRSTADVAVCLKLSLVLDQLPSGVPTRDADRLIRWFIGFVVMGVVVNLLSSFVVEQEWAWLPPAVFVAALLIAVLSTGLLRRERYRTTRARGMALLALTGYLAVAVWGSVTGWPFAVMILSLGYLWEAAVMLMWSTLRSRADLGHVALGTVCLLVGSAFLLLGVASPTHASTLGMVPGLLVRVAFGLLGVAALLLGVAGLLDGLIPVGSRSCSSVSRPCWAVLRPCWTAGHRSGFCSCCSASRRCWAVSRSCTVLNCGSG
jgi:hypothetical protein